MRRIVIFTGLAFATVAAAAAQPATLQLFGGRDFEAGEYSVAPLDDDSRASMGAAVNACLVSPESLMHAGFAAANGRDCAHTVVEDTPVRATIAYSCRGLGSGRTTIIKDNRSHFTVDAQGIRGREPFALRAEYKRTGDCAR